MLYSRDVISAVPLAMKAHSSSPALLKAAVNLLTALSSDGKSSHVLYESVLYCIDCDISQGNKIKISI